MNEQSRLKKLERVLAKYETKLHSSLWTKDWAEDPLSALIRGLIYVDYYLSVMLERRLAHPEALDLGKRAYSSKLRLARALDLIDEGLYGALLVFADVRNDLAHDLERTHDPEKLGRLEGALSGRAQLFMGYITGGSSRANQRLRHAIQAYVMAVEELAYPGFDAHSCCEGPFGSTVPDTSKEARRWRASFPCRDRTGRRVPRPTAKSSAPRTFRGATCGSRCLPHDVMTFRA
jgi:hypothetical protein